MLTDMIAPYINMCTVEGKQVSFIELENYSRGLEKLVALVLHTLAKTIKFIAFSNQTHIEE